MAWKCEICKDRGAVMGFNHPEVCECQRTVSQSGSIRLESKEMGATFQTSVNRPHRVVLDFDDPSDLYELLSVLNGGDFKMALRKVHNRIEMEFCRKCTSP